MKITFNFLSLVCCQSIIKYVGDDNDDDSNNNEESYLTSWGWKEITLKKKDQISEIKLSYCLFLSKT